MAQGEVVYSEAAVQQVVAAGFTREEAVEELSRSGGDPQKALVSLLAKSFAL